MARTKKHTENGDYYRAAQRFLRGALTRAGRAENVEWDLAALIALRQQLDDGIIDAVVAMRQADPEQASWTKLGQAMGCTRQAAQQKVASRLAKRNGSVA